MYSCNIIVGPQGADTFKRPARTRLQNCICTRRFVPSIRSGEGQDYGEHAVRNDGGPVTSSWSVIVISLSSFMELARSFWAEDGV